MNGRSGMLTSHRLHEAVRHVPQYATQQRYISSLGLSKIKKPDYRGAASDTQHLNNTWGALRPNTLTLALAGSTHPRPSVVPTAQACTSAEEGRRQKEHPKKRARREATRARRETNDD
eukprot:scaffold17559_cov110-Isochrysis_galbana.AAC.11